MDTRTTSRTRAVAALIGTVLFELGATAALVALGRVPSARIDTADLGRWLDTTPLVDVAFALLRLVALALVAYLLATTLIYVLARASRVPALVRAVAPLTLPAVRRVADRAVAGTLVTATLVGGVPVAATAATPPPTPVVGVTAEGHLLPPGLRVPTSTVDATDTASPDVPIPTPRPSAPTNEAETEDATPATPRGPAVPVPTRSAPRTPTPNVEAPPAPIPTPAPGSQRSEPTVARPAPAHTDDAAHTPPPPTPTPTAPSRTTADARDTWTAQRGDSLWHIAEHVVAEHLGVPVDEVADHEVAPYWHRLVAANRAALASGDPDVVAIGERISLPPLAGDAQADDEASPAGSTDVEGREH